MPPTANRAGYRRGRRLLFAYLATLFGLYVVIVLLLATSRYAGAREDLAAYLVFTVIASVSALAGYAITVGRAPWAFYVEGGTLVIRERFGRVRRFALGPELAVTAWRQPETGLFSPEPTEVLRLTHGREAPREYVLARGTLERFSEAERTHRPS